MRLIKYIVENGFEENEFLKDNGQTGLNFLCFYLSKSEIWGVKLGQAIEGNEPNILLPFVLIFDAPSHLYPRWEFETYHTITYISINKQVRFYYVQIVSSGFFFFSLFY